MLWPFPFLAAAPKVNWLFVVVENPNWFSGLAYDRDKDRGLASLLLLLLPLTPLLSSSCVKCQSSGVAVVPLLVAVLLPRFTGPQATMRLQFLEQIFSTLFCSLSLSVVPTLPCYMHISWDNPHIHLLPCAFFAPLVCWKLN